MKNGCLKSLFVLLFFDTGRMSVPVVILFDCFLRGNVNLIVIKKLFYDFYFVTILVLVRRDWVLLCSRCYAPLHCIYSTLPHTYSTSGHECFTAFIVLLIAFSQIKSFTRKQKMFNTFSSLTVAINIK